MTEKPLDRRVRNIERTVLSDDWAVLSRYSFDYERRDGRVEHQTREVYDAGDSASILPHDPSRGRIDALSPAS